MSSATGVISTADRKSFDENGVQFAWDATSITTAQTCLRLYYYKIICGWEPKGKSVHLIFGGIYADCLEAFYKHRADGDSIDEAQRKIVLQALTDSYGQEFDSSQKTRFTLVRSLVWYIEEFGDETDSHIKTLIKSNGRPAVEESFTLEVDSDLVLCGHLDRVVEIGDDKFVMDQKTTGQTIGPYYLDGFKLDNQFNLYPWAGRIIFDTPIRGMLIDAAQIAVNFTRFERAFIPKTQAQLDEWFESARYTIDSARNATALDKFPMNLTACGNYGGCDFKNICMRNPTIRKNYLAGDFTLSLGWDPINPRN